MKVEGLAAELADENDRSGPIWRGRVRALRPWILALPLVALSVGLDGVPIESWKELAEVRFGWPIAFVVQDQSMLSPPLPWVTRFEWNLWERPTHVLFGSLALNVFVVGSVIRWLMRRWWGAELEPRHEPGLGP